jgi:squalene-hopene/tetraprenyl-beta-curcumene cyclase
MNCTRGGILASISSGIEFLFKCRNSNGLWCDFNTLAGKSVDWVSSYVISSLADLAIYDEFLDRTLLYESTKEILYLQRPNGGWGYNGSVPTDSDSTAWALLALSCMPQWKPSAIEKGLSYLSRHQDITTGGGFSTYDEYDRIDEYINVEDKSLVKGWMSSHVSVTALALEAFLFCGQTNRSPILEHGLEYLLKAQERDFSWKCHWWSTESYPTYQTAKILALCKRLDIQQYMAIQGFLLLKLKNERAPSTNDWEGPQAFDAANDLLTILLFPERSAGLQANDLLKLLLQAQLSDGSWPASPILRIPPPMTENAMNIQEWGIDLMGTQVIVTDQERVFTTATVLSALSTYCDAFK